MLSLLRPATKFVASAVLLLAAAAVASADSRPAPASAPPPAPARIGQIQHARPGPWGTVEYTRIMIEPPDEFMAADYTAKDHSVWNFPDYTPEKLAALWAAAGLNESQRTVLDAPANRTKNADGYSIRVDSRTVRLLPPAARAHIYSELGRLSGNPIHQMPFRFRTDMVGEWLEDADFPDDVVAEIKRLLYHRGNSVLFADPDLILPMLSTPAERVRLVKTLSRKSALLVRLRLNPQSDVDGLADYWSRGSRRRDVRPLLQSLARHRDGISLDITHLMPRFARGLIYTYPSQSEKPDTTLDCHWTALNFFNEEADRRFADINFVLETLERDYEQVPYEPPLQFGDILLFTRPGGEVFHSCIHIADEIVFTKNGYSNHMPWLLSTVRDMLAAYPLEPDMETLVYRRRSH